MRCPALLFAILVALLVPSVAVAADPLTSALKRIDGVTRSDKERAGRMLDELRAEYPDDKLRDHQRMQIGTRLVALGRLGQAGAVLNGVAGARGGALPAGIKGVDLEARIAAMALVGRVDEAAETMKGCANASPPKAPCGVFRTVGLVRKFHRPGVAMKLLQAFGDKREGPAQQAGTAPPAPPPRASHPPAKPANPASSAPAGAAGAEKEGDASDTPAHMIWIPLLAVAMLGAAIVVVRRRS